MSKRKQHFQRLPGGFWLRATNNQDFAVRGQGTHDQINPHQIPSITYNITWGQGEVLQSTELSPTAIFPHPWTRPACYRQNTAYTASAGSRHLTNASNYFFQHARWENTLLLMLSALWFKSQTSFSSTQKYFDLCQKFIDNKVSPSKCLRQQQKRR